MKEYQLESAVILQVLLNQTPLSFEGIGFVDIGLTRDLARLVNRNKYKMGHTFYVFE